VSFPDSQVYQSEEASYFSQQQESVESVCRVTASAATDVSLSLLTFRVTQCDFAVKSGGHAMFAGASNIANGVTIDLSSLTTLTVSADKTQTSIGTGLRWIDVYTQLDPMGLSVIGGRVSAIGSGGLTLGGGISFFSARFGWACDNVNNYEVSDPPCSSHLACNAKRTYSIGRFCRWHHQRRQPGQLS
jgi:FAD/FMN-containing dehydrogenase